jgi:O-antigen/teichoic acid export membrane protein
MPKQNYQHLISSKTITISIIWSSIGLIMPLVAGVFSIPLLIEEYGQERFGLLGLVWLGVGYFSLFDMGMGRTLTRIVSQHISRGNKADINPIISNAFQLLMGLGVTGGVVLAFFSKDLVSMLLNQENLNLFGDAIQSLYVLSAGIPVIVITAGLIGVLEAHQQFKEIAKIRILLGLSTFLAPLLAVQFDERISVATVLLLAIRIMAMIAYYRVCNVLYPKLSLKTPINLVVIKLFAGYAGWLTISNIIGPIMTTMDRFLISAKLGLSWVTYYVTPYEMLSRLQVIPQAVSGVLFPAMTSAHEQDKERLLDIFKYGGKFLFWLIFPLTLVIFLFASDILYFWLNTDFEKNSTFVVQCLCIGWAINVLAQPAHTALQAIGRPDLTAKTHIAELPIYLIFLWTLAEEYGINGVAVAWTVRVILDALILNAIVISKIKLLQAQAKFVIFTILYTVLIFIICWKIKGDFLKIITLVFILVYGFYKNLPILKFVFKQIKKKI